MEEGKSLMDTVRPPRLEDAGLEDCALPPEAIQEAFLKAAAATCLQSPLFNGRDCVHDPSPIDDGDFHDSLIGISPVPDTPFPCAGEKGILPETEGGRACVEGLLQGLEIEERGEEEGFERNEEEDDAAATLTEES